MQMDGVCVYGYVFAMIFDDYDRIVLDRATDWCDRIEI